MAHKEVVAHSVGLLILALVTGCASMCPPAPQHGPSGNITRTIRGLDVLAVEDLDERVTRGTAAARSAGELAALWRTYGLPTPLPEVDFDRYVVVAWAGRVTSHVEELVAADLLSDGQLAPLLERAPIDDNETDWRRVVYVAAVPREHLPPTFVVSLETDAAESRTRVTLDARPQPMRAEPEPREDDVPLRGEVLGTVPLPTNTGATLGNLDDHTPVWVVRHADGTISVLAADVASTEHAGSGLIGVREAVIWLPERQRFFGGGGTFDEYGASTMGRYAPDLDRYTFAVVPGVPPRVAVGQRIGGTSRRTVAPFPSDEANLAGIDPYRLNDGLLPWPTTSLEGVPRQPEGALVVVSAALSAAPDGPVRLCTHAPPLGCPPEAIEAPGVTRMPWRRRILWWAGPLLARVRGGRLTDIVRLSSSQGGDDERHAREEIALWAYERAQTAQGARADRSWMSGEAVGLRFELGLGALLGAGTRGEVVVGGMLRFGPRWWDPPTWETRVRQATRADDVFDTLVGDVLGVDLRLRWFALANDRDRTGYGLAVGLAPSFQNGVGVSSLRVPSLLGLLPEVGVLLRSTDPARAYVAFAPTIGVLLDRRSAVEFGVTALVYDDGDWFARAGVQVTAGVTAVFR